MVTARMIALGDLDLLEVIVVHAGRDRLAHGVRAVAARRLDADLKP